MTKKKLIIFGIVAAIIGGLSFYYIFIKEDQNKLFVTVDNTLISDKIRIDEGFYSINSGSDDNLIKLGLGKTVYSDNNAKSFETICGENDFLVVYDNQFYTVVRHFIPNDFYDGIPKPHKYNFDFKRIEDKIHLTLNIEGQDGEKIERELVNVSDANNNIWGRQIEK
ncbi:MAG: hypothetical protein ACOVSR_03400 [Bacteroidia bacterium]|jgi:hypothetical protein